MSLWKGTLSVFLCSKVHVFPSAHINRLVSLLVKTLAWAIGHITCISSNTGHVILSTRQIFKNVFSNLNTEPFLFVKFRVIWDMLLAVVKDAVRSGLFEGSVDSLLRVQTLTNFLVGQHIHRCTYTTNWARLMRITQQQGASVSKRRWNGCVFNTRRWHWCTKVGSLVFEGAGCKL